MTNICLDKTIGETLKYLNGATEIPNSIQVVDFCGMPSTFGFKSGQKFETPIEHIGFAKLCYEEALKTFYTTKVNQDGSIETVFERLSDGQHVSDCLNNFSNDIFSWYKGRDCKPLELVVFPECFIHKPDLINYEKYCNFDSDNENNQNIYRIDVADNAIKSAIEVYTSELLSRGEATEEECAHIKSEEEYEKILTLSDMYRMHNQENTQEEILEQ